jgi:lysophospholipase L1-like esterase
MRDHRKSALALLALALGIVLPGAAGPADLTPVASVPAAAYDGPVLTDDLDLPRVARRLASGRRIRIVAFGSSSTEGVGASSPAAAYPARLEVELRRTLAAKNSVSVLNRGIGGEHAVDMLARLDRDVLAASPDLVIWQTGSNDPLRGVPLGRFIELTRIGLERMRAAGLDVMLMEPQWCPALEATAGADLYRDALRALGRELRVPVIRRADLMRRWVEHKRLPKEQLLSADGLHMADGGYALLAADVAKDILLRASRVRPGPATASSTMQTKL